VPRTRKRISERSASGIIPDEEIREFTNYLVRTLIPDLHESGRHETADDFEMAVAVIRQYRRELER
jgi:hypothetical protein